jgi:hypothetical protein
MAMCRSGVMACDWAVQNANNVIGMLLFLTTEIVQPFMRKELADRIAAMLNDWLLHLVGPRSQASHATDLQQRPDRPAACSGLRATCNRRHSD